MIKRRWILGSGAVERTSQQAATELTGALELSVSGLVGEYRGGVGPFGLKRISQWTESEPHGRIPLLGTAPCARQPRNCSGLLYHPRLRNGAIWLRRSERDERIRHYYSDGNVIDLSG